MRFKNRNNQRPTFLCVLVLLVLCVSCNQAKTQGLPNKTLVIEGTLEKLGPDTGMLSGRIAVYRLAKYRVERVCEGNYDSKEIVVDHLILSGKEFEDISVGDRVCLTLKISDQIAVRYNAEGIRRSTDTVKTFYVAHELITRRTHPSDCCK